MNTIYDRMAASPLLKTINYTSGNSPTKKYYVMFGYQNGLVVEYDGNNWTVLKPEDEQS